MYARFSKSLKNLYSTTAQAHTQQTVWHCENFFLSEYYQKAKMEAEGRNAVIVVNNPYDSLPKSDFQAFWVNSDVRICADGGANLLYSMEDLRDTHSPDFLVGDLDSIQTPVLEYFQRKGTKVMKEVDENFTDLEKCFAKLVEMEEESKIPWTSILILGGLGGNVTQELSNLNILYKFSQYRIFLRSLHNLAFLLTPGTHVITMTGVLNSKRRQSEKVRKTVYCGIIPLGGQCRSVKTRGLKWDLNGEGMNFGGLISSSNEMLKDKVVVEVSDKVLWTFDYR